VNGVTGGSQQTANLNCDFTGGITVGILDPSVQIVHRVSHESELDHGTSQTIGDEETDFGFHQIFPIKDLAGLLVTLYPSEWSSFLLAAKASDSTAS
jgi:hypothetical protein